MKVLKEGDITESEFDTYLENNNLVVVDYYADWCGPCMKIAPLFDMVANNYPNVKVIKINIDDHQDIASKHNVESLPTIHFYHRSKLYQSEVGIRGGGKFIIISIANLLAREDMLENYDEDVMKDEDKKNDVYNKKVKKISNEISKSYMDYLDELEEG